MPSAHGEEEILACVTLRAGAALTPQDLVAYLAPRTAHFMVPRYVRILDALPMTETNKVRKADLRAPDILAGAWDREAAGVVLKKERLTSQ